MRAVWGEPAHTTSDPLPVSCDDVVIGAGVTGLVTALTLARAGRDVCVLEARRAGAGATGRSTAKFSLLQGTRLQQVVQRQSVDVGRSYVAANRTGLEWLRAFCEDQGIVVQERVAATYARSADEVGSVRTEHQTALELGLDVAWHDGPLDGLPSHGATTLAGQLQADPVHLVQKLVAAVRSAGGRVVEGARVRRLSPDAATVHLEGGRSVRADSVVVATGTPVIDRGLHVTQVKPMRSYTVAYRWDGRLEHMALSAGSDGRSVRDAVDRDGNQLLLVGGAGHVVGRTRDESAHLGRLRDWTRQHFADAVEVAAWSAQDYEPTHGVPLVGRMPLTRGRVRVATGFAKWGFTNGTAAALAIASDIVGDEPLHLPGHYLGATPAPASWARNNATVGLRQVRDVAQVAFPGAGDVGVTDAARGCGICPHMGGVLHWNTAERSWDCPLHGSRFAPDGSVLEGPATRPAKVPSAPETTEPAETATQKGSPMQQTEQSTPHDASGGQVSEPEANPVPPGQDPSTTPGVDDTPQTAPDQEH